MKALWAKRMRKVINRKKNWSSKKKSSMKEVIKREKN